MLIPLLFQKKVKIESCSNFWKNYSYNIFSEKRKDIYFFLKMHDYTGKLKILVTIRNIPKGNIRSYSDLKQKFFAQINI